MKCKCCESKDGLIQILHLAHMPGSAQGFLSEENLEGDSEQALDLFQCRYCGLIQLISDPVPYYRDVIRASAVSDEMKHYRSEYFQSFVDRYNLKERKVLEVGAGAGEFLKLMHDTGADVYGVEHNPKSVQRCMENGLRTECLFFDDTATISANAPYHAFFIMNFLEHIPEPDVFLKAIYNNLYDGAIGLVEVPNVDMVLKECMVSELIQDHLMYFTRESLELLLRKNGFEVLSCKSVWHDYCLAAEVKKRTMYSMDSFEDAKMKISIEINDYIDNRSDNGKIVVWGAGHQALALLGLCDLREKVSYIVDSADFKQGKYTPGTHLMIKSPDVLESDRDVSTVIVMGASFSDEIVRIVKSRFPWLKIAMVNGNRLEIKV